MHLICYCHDLTYSTDYIYYPADYIYFTDRYDILYRSDILY